MKKRISLLMVCMMVIVTMATACGGKDLSNSKYVGTWVGKTAEYEGMEISVETLFGDFNFTLEGNGKATAHVDGEDKTGKWDETEKGIILDDEMNSLRTERSSPMKPTALPYILKSSKYWD